MTKPIKKTPAETEVLGQSIATVPEKKELVNQEMDIDGFLAKRQEFIEKVNAIMVEGKDFHVIQGKKSLAKGGAEKIASIFGWQSEFTKDTDVSEAFQIDGLIAFVCRLSKHAEFVGQGRGAATLGKNSNDPNKTIKMAQKSAFIDAVIRASGMSDFFTQDLEDLKQEDIGPTHTQQALAISPSEKQLDLINKVMIQKDVTPSMVADQGFDLNNLTGGKEGTASELIDWLFKYNTRDLGDYMDFSLRNEPEHLFIKDLDNCNTIAAYEQICSDIRLARENKKLSDIGYQEVLKVAKKVAEKLKQRI